MSYPKAAELKHATEMLAFYAKLKHEYGAKNIQKIIDKAVRDLKSATDSINKLPNDVALEKQEPSSLKFIQKLRPSGPRRITSNFNSAIYADRLEGAFLGRMAACTLGAPVEAWSIDRMAALARENSMDFPPRDYWKYVPDPYTIRYLVSQRDSYTRDKMDGVPADDDIIYTLLGLLILEEYGPDFTVDDVGAAWVKYLSMSYTAEKVALDNLKAGISAKKAADKNNPFTELIGADIRADPWGYVAPGWPEKAAELAWRDAYLSHRRNGIYGAMYFAAVIAAAFTADDPCEALIIGLSEIPANCTLAKEVRWALEEAHNIKNYKDARAAVDQRFADMAVAHTINNACLTVFGITIGRTDFTRVISEVVAMGLDNDCTAATAGSIVGAVVGKNGIPDHWYRNFNSHIHSYLIKKRIFKIDDVLKRFAKQAKKICATT